MSDPSHSFTIRRPIPALGLWPDDTVRTREDGSLELVRVLPANAGDILREAELLGDARPHVDDH